MLSKIKIITLLAVLAIASFIFDAGNASAAAIVSAQSGDWSQGPTWVGNVVPGDGDTVTITSGHTINVDQNTVVGVRTGIAHGILINATNSSNFGKLVVNTGVTLTMKGVDNWGHFAMKISQYAVFQPLNGSRIEVDCASDSQTGISNYGIIDTTDAIGKAPVVFSVPPANINWNKAASTTITTSYNGWPYDNDKSIARLMLSRWIANSTGTGIGSNTDTSINVVSATPDSGADQIMKPGQMKASISDVINSGDWFVDHYVGVVYFKHNYTLGNPSIDVTYKRLDDAGANWKGWFIDGGYNNDRNISYNEMLFDNCIFEYMGPLSNTTKTAIIASDKKTPSVSPDHRNFYIKNSTFRFCGSAIAIGNANEGTEQDPILIDNNKFYECASTINDLTNASAINFKGSGSNFVKISNNYADTTLFLELSGSNVVNNARIINNKAFSNHNFSRNFYPSTVTTYNDGLFENNYIEGLNNGYALLDVKGAVGHPLIINKNTIKYSGIGMATNGYTNFTNNFVGYAYSGGITGALGFNFFNADVNITNNVFYGLGTRKSTLPNVYETYNGYGGAVGLHTKTYSPNNWYDNWNISNNTVSGVRNGLLTVGLDCGSCGSMTLATRIKVQNNLVRNGEFGMRFSSPDSANKITRGGIMSNDSNLFYGQTVSVFSGGLNSSGTFLINGDEYNSLSLGQRNVTGVELWNPSYLSNQNGRSLSLNINSLTDWTLRWGSGTPQQLYFDSGSLTTNASHILQSEQPETTLITDNSKNWSVVANDALSPKGRYIKFTSGILNGQVFAIGINMTSASFNITPATPSLPSAGDTYVIFNSQVSLDDGEGGTVKAGIFGPQLPSTSQTDENITFTTGNTLNVDPRLLNHLGTNVTDYDIAIDSPARNAGSGGQNIGADVSLVGSDLIFSDPAPGAPSGLHVE